MILNNKYITTYYGLLRSETLGLKWNVINLDDKTKNKYSYRSSHSIPEIEEILLKEKQLQYENK